MFKFAAITAAASLALIAGALIFNTVAAPRPSFADYRQAEAEAVFNQVAAELH